MYRCVATAPRPSSVCFADTFPGGEGNPLRRGRADRVVRPYKKGVVGALQVSPKGDAQRAETFRVVGTGATGRGRPSFFESNSGLRLALCPLSFLGSLKPFFFSGWEKKNGFKKRSHRRSMEGIKTVRPFERQMLPEHSRKRYFVSSGK